MKDSTSKWFDLGVPTAWGELFGRTVTTAAVGFGVLQLEEWLDVGSFDTRAAAVDALLIAAGTFAVYAILKWGKPRSGAAERRPA